MHSFKEFCEVQNREQGYGYVSVKPISESLHLIRKLINNSGIENSLNNAELHMTLAYDANNPVLTVDAAPQDTIINGTMKEVKLLGDALVVVLESDEAQQRYEELADLGFGSDYPDYIPHISLKYDASKEDFLDARNVFKKFKGKNVKLYSENWEFNTGNYC